MGEVRGEIERPAEADGGEEDRAADRVVSSIDGEGAGVEVVAVPRGLSRTFSSLRIASFRWLWLGQLFLFASMQMQQVARGWLVYDMTGSALALGLVTAAWGLPIMGLSLLGGVLADRVQKRNLLVVTYIATGVISLVVTGLIIGDIIRFWHLVATAFAMGIATAFSSPGRHAFVIDLVSPRELMNAIALSNSGFNFSRIWAPLVAGVLVGIIGVGGVYLLLSSFYIVVVATLLMIPTLKVVAPPSRTSIKASLTEGLQYTKQAPNIPLLLMMTAVLTFFAFPYMTLMPVFAVDIFQRGSVGFGLLVAVSGVGALMGSLSIAYLGDFRRKGLLLLGLGIGFGVALILFASSGLFYLSLFFLLFVGATGMGYMPVNNTLIQSNVSPEMRGRVMSVYTMAFSMMPVGALLLGAIADAWGAPFAVGLGGGIVVLCCLLAALFRPALRNLQ